MRDTVPITPSGDGADGAEGRPLASPRRPPEGRRPEDQRRAAHRHLERPLQRLHRDPDDPVAPRPTETRTNGFVANVISSGGEVTEQNGFNCTQGGSALPGPVQLAEGGHRLRQAQDAGARRRAEAGVREHRHGRAAEAHNRTPERQDERSGRRDPGRALPRALAASRRPGSARSGPRPLGRGLWIVERQRALGHEQEREAEADEELGGVSCVDAGGPGRRGLGPPRAGRRRTRGP